MKVPCHHKNVFHLFSPASVNFFRFCGLQFGEKQLFFRPHFSSWITWPSQPHHRKRMFKFSQVMHRLGTSGHTVWRITVLLQRHTVTLLLLFRTPKVWGNGPAVRGIVTPRRYSCRSSCSKRVCWIPAHSCRRPVTVCYRYHVVGTVRVVAVPGSFWGPLEGIVDAGVAGTGTDAS